MRGSANHKVLGAGTGQDPPPALAGTEALGAGALGLECQAVSSALLCRAVSSAVSPKKISRPLWAMKRPKFSQQTRGWPRAQGQLGLIKRWQSGAPARFPGGLHPHISPAQPLPAWTGPLLPVDEPSDLLRLQSGEKLPFLLFLLLLFIFGLPCPSSSGPTHGEGLGHVFRRFWQFHAAPLGAPGLPRQVLRL